MTPCDHLYCPNCVKTWALKKPKPTCTGYRCKNKHDAAPEFRLLRPEDGARVESRVFHISSDNMARHVPTSSPDRGLFEVVIGIWKGPNDSDLDTVQYRTVVSILYSTYTVLVFSTTSEQNSAQPVKSCEKLFGKSVSRTCSNSCICLFVRIGRYVAVGCIRPVH